MSEKIEFVASLSPTSSAISLDGSGNGARVKLEVPQTDIAAVIKLACLTGKLLKVTITSEE